MADFFQVYFIDPIFYNTGYNIVNTAVFAIILIAAIFAAYKLLRLMKIPIDNKFFIGIIPFVVLGGVLRAFEDLLEAIGATQGLLSTFLNIFVLVDASGIVRNLLLISPIIYIVVFLVALVSLLLAKAIEKYRKISYWKSWAVIGVILNLLILSQLRFQSSFAFFAVIGITIVWLAVIFGAKKIAFYKNLKIKEFFTTENTFLLNVHMFDATTTFVALTYFNYFEQHVLPSFLIDIFGPGAMFVLKLAVVSVVLYVFDKELSKPQDIEKRTFLKIVVLILGMGPGIRNFLRMIMGV